MKKYTLKSHLAKVCAICKGRFYASRITHLYCSRKCSNAAMHLKKIEAAEAATEEMQERVILHATSAAIPPQNLAYRWLYTANEAIQGYEAVRIAANYPSLGDGGTCE